MSQRIVLVALSWSRGNDSQIAQRMRLPLASVHRLSVGKANGAMTLMSIFTAIHPPN